MSVDVLLVNTPWAEYHRPSMQLGLIQALLQRSGIECQTLNTTLQFAEIIGPALYRQAEDFHRPHCEWVFSGAAFDLPESSDQILLRRLQMRGADEQTINTLRYLRSVVNSFVNDSVTTILRIKPSIVGFTTAMLQTTASAAIASRLKRLSPSIQVVFGGVHCENDTGESLMYALPCIDIAVTQQCDAWIGELFLNVLQGKSIKDQPGIIWRLDNKPIKNPAAERFDALDSNPIPDFSDYFDQLEHSPLNESFERSVPFEGSRGCWWGERRHCRFCGLNGTIMSYRHRSAKSVVDEIIQQRQQYQASTFIAVDEIIPKKFFTDLPAHMRDKLFDIALFYEMSPSVSRRQLESLASVCQLHSQPGIEHLSDRVLTLMGKGLKAVNNVALLRRSQEFNVHLLWNLIFGIPGEKLEDYTAITKTFDALFHLTPPNLIPLTLTRYSPYYTNQVGFGLYQSGVQQDFDLAYPVAKPLLENLAMNFEYEVNEGLDGRIQPLLQEIVSKWSNEYKAGARLHVMLSGETVYVDENRCIPRRYALCDASSLLYRLLEKPRSAENLIQIFRQIKPSLYIRCGGSQILRTLINQMLDHRIIWSHNHYYVAIAVPSHNDFWLELDRKPLLDSIPVTSIASGT